MNDIPCYSRFVNDNESKYGTKDKLIHSHSSLRLSNQRPEIDSFFRFQWDKLRTRKKEQFN